MNTALKSKLANHKVSMRFGLFRKITNAMSAFNENVVFIISKDKFCISQLDEKRIALIEVEFNKNQYKAVVDYSEIEELTIAISRETIGDLNHQFKSSIYDDETIEIIVTEVYENKASSIIIQLPALNFLKEIGECELKSSHQYPVIEFKTSITLSTIQLKEKLKGMKGDNAIIVATPHSPTTLKYDKYHTVVMDTEDTFILYNPRDDKDKPLVKFPIVKLPILKWNSAPSKTEAWFNKQYLIYALDFVMNEYDDITVSFSNDLPILLEQESGECVLRFFLGPRIETDA